MKSLKLLFIAILFISIHSCEKNEAETRVSLELVNGYVQKGPYLNGTSITISELTTDFIPTGKNFTTQIIDNKGSFIVKNVELESEYIELKAEGFFYNEATDQSSSAQLTLYSLSSLKDKSSLNANILSNLEKNRVEFLLLNGSDFKSAKKQAQSEILSIFEIQKPDILESELLDITVDGDDNAILLAISLIIQGYQSVGELSELMANISTDIREDGVLNSNSLGTTLHNNAKLLRLSEIRSNLINRFDLLGLPKTIPDFEKFVNQFIDSTDFGYTGSIDYPVIGKHGPNILDKDKTEYNTTSNSMIVNLSGGTNVKVKIRGEQWSQDNFESYTGWSNATFESDAEYYHSGTFNSEDIGIIDRKISLFWTASDSGYVSPNTLEVQVFENDAIIPTWTKQIKILKP